MNEWISYIFWIVKRIMNECINECMNEWMLKTNNGKNERMPKLLNTLEECYRQMNA